MPEQLIPARTIGELAIAIRLHLATCDRDHSQTMHQSRLIQFNPGLSTLACAVCKNTEELNKPPIDGGKLDTYVCHLLRQQQNFYDLHFASCAATKGGIA